ncbi:hypothetical protein ACTMTU_05745 [Streptomyces sp. OZ13]|uniref:hypothetical protein n=1 Tax=Streptomyces sp. OZ13 TaxID=3452210 RepID=UPI003F8A088F
MTAGCQEFLTATTDPDVQQVMLGPAVLGRSQWRARWTRPPSGWRPPPTPKICPKPKPRWGNCFRRCAQTGARMPELLQHARPDRRPLRPQLPVLLRLQAHRWVSGGADSARRHLVDRAGECCADGSIGSLARPDSAPYCANVRTGENSPADPPNVERL